MAEITDDRIREKAYQIWQREGCPEGRDREHWQLARSELAASEPMPGATLPNPVAEQGGGDEATHSEPVEPVLATEALGDLPGLTDQGEKADYPASQQQEVPPPDIKPAPRRKRA